MRAVNLLPADYGHGRKTGGPRLPGPLSDPRRAAPIAAALLLVALLAVGYVTQSRSVSDRQETLDALQAELAARPKPEPTADPTSDAAVRLAAATAASAARVAWEEVLHQFALVLPADVSVTSMTATGTASGFMLSGHTVSQPAVARLLTRLDEAPTLSNVQLQTSARGEMEGGVVFNFSILADVVPEGAGS